MLKRIPPKENLFQQSAPSMGPSRKPTKGVTINTVNEGWESKEQVVQMNSSSSEATQMLKDNVIGKLEAKKMRKKSVTVSDDCRNIKKRQLKTIKVAVQQGTLLTQEGSQVEIAKLQPRTITPMRDVDMRWELPPKPIGEPCSKPIESQFLPKLLAKLLPMKTRLYPP